MIDKPNISTENQPSGSARNPSDTLDKPPEEKAPAISPETKKNEKDDRTFGKNGG